MATAPRDGSIFICASATTWVGGQKRQCDVELHFSRVSRYRSVPESDGFWLCTVYDHSIPDSHVAHGYWTTTREWDNYLLSLAPWREAPTNEIVVFVTEGSNGHIASVVAWWREDWGGWASANSHGRAMHPGYLDGQNTGLPPMRWAPLASLWSKA
jgi:hypothetical protein